MLVLNGSSLNHVCFGICSRGTLVLQLARADRQLKRKLIYLHQILNTTNWCHYNRRISLIKYYLNGVSMHTANFTNLPLWVPPLPKIPFLLSIAQLMICHTLSLPIADCTPTERYNFSGLFFLKKKGKENTKNTPMGTLLSGRWLCCSGMSWKGCLALTGEVGLVVA